MGAADTIEFMGGRYACDNDSQQTGRVGYREKNPESASTNADSFEVDGSTAT